MHTYWQKLVKWEADAFMEECSRRNTNEHRKQDEYIKQWWYLSGHVIHGNTF